MRFCLCVLSRCLVLRICTMAGDVLKPASFPQTRGRYDSIMSVRALSLYALVACLAIVYFLTTYPLKPVNGLSVIVHLFS